MQILKEDVDYPKKNKKRAVRDITLYPPRIELEISRRKRTASQLNFKLKVEGVRRSLSLNISLLPSPSICSTGAVSPPEVANSPDTELSSLELDSSSVSSESNSAEKLSGSVHSVESSGYSSQDSHEGSNG